MNFKQFSTSDNQWHDTPYYQHKTATDTLTLPAVIYPNDTSITVGVKGNTVQNGTPTPDSPVMPEGTGERTGNLLNPAIIENGYNINTSGNIIVDNRRIATTQPIDVTSENTVTITYSYEGSTINCIYAIFSGGTMVDRYASAVSGTSIDVSGGDKLYLCWYRGSETITKDDISNLMLNTGSTPLPYEPWGIKIPILMGGTTNNVYLGEVQTVRQIKKLVLTGEENWERQSGQTADYFRISNMAALPSKVFCTHYESPDENINYASTATGIKMQQSASYGVILACRPTNVSTLSGFTDYLATQYSNGTPVCVWYVLAEPTTGITNEPLMKIGTYADSLTTSIPVTAGENTLDVQTTVQPSEVTAGFSGWHPVQSVHERENGQWD